jgi:hypothetical protein
MNDVTRISAGTLLDAEKLETILSLPKGSFSAVAWLMIQEQAKGVSLSDVAKKLSCDEGDLIALRDATTGKTDDESQSVWDNGILSLRTSYAINDHHLETGWDSVEALALKKVHGQLANMQSNGDLDQMLRVAAAANKAVRRGRGEGGSRETRINVGADGAVTAELPSGNLGFIRLRLSRPVQEQLQQSERIIDGSVRKPSITDKLRMLSLEETRIVGDSGQLDEKARMKAAMTDLFKDFKE